MPRTRLFLSALPVLIASVVLAQGAKPTFDLSIKNIMRGTEHFGREPQNVRWSLDGQWIYFNWLPAGSDWRDATKPYRVRAQAGATPEAVSPAEMDRLEPVLASGPISRDGTKKLTNVRGEIWLVDLRGNSARRLTQTVAAESNASWSSDGNRVFFVRDGNAYSVDLTNGDTRQMTDIRPGPTAGAPAAAPPAAGGGRGGGGGGRGAGGRGGDAPPTQGAGRGANAQRTTMEAEQRQLFQVFRDAARADSIRRLNAAREDLDLPRAVTLGANERVGNISVSPTGTSVLFNTIISVDGARNTIVPNYVTSSGYTEDIAGRTDVGDVQGSGRLGFMTLPRGEVVWIDPLPAAPGLAGNAAFGGWSADGSSALISAGARNFKTRQWSTVDGGTGALKTIEVIRDTAWVGGPCGNCMGWLDGGRRVYWVSETNGFAQLHSALPDGSSRTEITGNQKWEVYDVSLSNDGKTIYYHSSETSHFDQDLWSVSTNGGARTKLTANAGGHQVVLSPDERLMADVYSTNANPPEIYLSTSCAGMPSCKPTLGTHLTTSTSEAFRAGPWKEMKIVDIPASDGVNVPAHIITPQEMGARPNGAAVIFVHGAGYLHNIVHYWKPYPREYMYNHFLASKGYVVLDIDYRASAGYGRDWRTAIYRWMGGRDLADQVDGSKWLTKTYGINPERIGMYGGSYGGFMTLMALFTAPKYFGSGAALRSVTDWAHYNHGYTGPILNLPQDDTLSYHRSSPIFLAEGLEDPLLMLHGMVDTNVHFQDIVRLTQRLIELGKTDWWLAPYPVENHGFERPDSWTDEYRRIFEHFEATIGPKGSKVVKR